MRNGPYRSLKSCVYNSRVSFGGGGLRSLFRRVMASDGQVVTHSPQPMHLSSWTTGGSSSLVIASIWQRVAQAPQIWHFSRSTTARKSA